MPKRRKKKKQRKPLPLNYDPEKYIWVNTKEGGHPRRKRGTVKPALLNNVLQQNATITRETNEAAKRVMGKLYPFLQYLKTGRTVVRIAGAFKKSIASNGNMDYSFLEKLDFQDDYPFEDLAPGLLQMTIDRGLLHLHLPVGNLNVKRHSQHATGYYVEAILLFGDPAKTHTLRIDSAESRIYTFEEEGQVPCDLSIQLPEKQPWMVLLKVSCTGRYVEDIAKYKALKVVKVGKGVSKLS